MEFALQHLSGSSDGKSLVRAVHPQCSESGLCSGDHDSGRATCRKWYIDDRRATNCERRTVEDPCRDDVGHCCKFETLPDQLALDFPTGEGHAIDRSFATEFLAWPALDDGRVEATCVRWSRQDEPCGGCGDETKELSSGSVGSGHK